jgi:peptidoglycan/xylan/chitin deacetylase (PgdA/CDA1 family)
VRRSLILIGEACHPVTRAVFSPGGPAGLSILCWHRVDDGPGPLSVTVSEFEAQLDVIEGWGATILPLEDALLRARNGTLPRRAMVLTFDDGYRSTLDAVWPRLEARGWPGTLFAVPGYLDGQSYFPWDSAAGDPARLLNLPELLELARRGMHIGSHTVSHRWLPRLADDELAMELRDSRRALERVLSQRVTTLAYPAGHFDARVRAAVAAAGYAHGLRYREGQVDVTNRPVRNSADDCSAGCSGSLAHSGRGVRLPSAPRCGSRASPPHPRVYPPGPVSGPDPSLGVIGVVPAEMGLDSQT